MIYYNILNVLIDFFWLICVEVYNNFFFVIEFCKVRLRNDFINKHHAMFDENFLNDKIVQKEFIKKGFIL